MVEHDDILRPQGTTYFRHDDVPSLIVNHSKEVTLLIEPTQDIQELCRSNRVQYEP